MLPLPGLNVRELTRAVPDLLRDTSTQAILCAGDHQIALWGTGTDVAGWAALLQAAERGEVPLEEGVRRWLESVEARGR